MNRNSSRTIIGWFILTGIILGLVAAWQLSRRPRSNLAYDPPVTPTLEASRSTDLDFWIVPTQAGEVFRPGQASRQRAKIGGSAPDFSLSDRNGNLVRLSDFLGKAIVINFWASWCPPCRDEIPALRALADEFAEEGLVVLGVNTTYVDNYDHALSFIDEMEFSFPIVFDQDGQVSQQSFGVFGLPTSYWIDREGVVQAIIIGALSKEKMVELAGQILSP